MPKIAMLGYKEFIDQASTIVKRKKFRRDIFVHSCYQDECVTLLPKLIDKKVDIIITGYINKKIFENICDIPVISFKITSYDILSSIKKTINNSKRIAVALPSDQGSYDYRLLSELINVDLQMIYFDNEAHLRRGIKEFSSKAGVIIGSSLAVNIARENGLIGQLVYSLESTIEESIQRAEEIVYYKHKEEKFNREFKAIINSVTDGILTTNNKEEITLLNKSASKLLKVPKKDLHKQKLQDILPIRIYQDFVKEKIKRNFLIKLDDNNLALNKTPINIRDHVVGSVYTFHDINKVQEIDNKFRIQSRETTWKAKVTFDDILSKSHSMKTVVEEAKIFSQTDSTVLIKGETGTGKEMFAQSIHNHSNRNMYPFVAVNCAALPDSLLESELFGYKDGAFTGASQRGKKGLFEIAHKGTIFLDEINSTSTSFQVKLLRVLQEKEIVPIGSDKVVKVDLRIIAAANKNLVNLINKEKFRADLYYRLNVLEINIPPLRNRLDDLPLLVEQFFSNNLQFYRNISNYIPTISKVLSEYHFPGNIRELFNILERFILLCDVNRLPNLKYLEQLLLRHMDQNQANPDEGVLLQFNPHRCSYKDALYEAEKVIIQAYNDISSGNKTKLAKLMGVTRATLYRKLKELQLEETL